MTDTLRRLLSEATPGPWIRPWGTYSIRQAFGRGGECTLPQPDIDLITAAVNALPVLLDVAEAARLLMAAHDHYQPHDELGLREALSRLEETTR